MVVYSKTKLLQLFHSLPRQEKYSIRTKDVIVFRRDQGYNHIRKSWQL